MPEIAAIFKRFIPIAPLARQWLYRLRMFGRLTAAKGSRRPHYNEAYPFDSFRRRVCRFYGGPCVCPELFGRRGFGGFERPCGCSEPDGEEASSLSPPQSEEERHVLELGFQHGQHGRFRGNGQPCGELIDFRHSESRTCTGGRSPVLRFVVPKSGARQVSASDNAPKSTSRVLLLQYSC